MTGHDARTASQGPAVHHENVETSGGPPRLRDETSSQEPQADAPSR
ncbi:MAG TPA: hypothetical protein VF469_38565 [Kofleriaceae bacterium]